MTEVTLKDWASFEGAVSKILEDFQWKRPQKGVRAIDPLFRGQADAGGPLRTTLERFSPRAWSIGNYYRIVRAVKPAVVSLTGKAWPRLPDVVEERLEGVEDSIPGFDGQEHGPPPGYEFMIYMRHHGFPSPLLDWSRSPYVAAFFAFQSRAPHEGCEAVALYSFVEEIGYGKTWESDKGWIIGLGPYAETHPRHYAQQCEYTICKKLDLDRGSRGNRYIYASHEDALQAGRGVQDILTKHIIPMSERRHFLRKLESMNVHAYSLFGDETALMHTLAYREIERRDDR